jgi:hypothetical protein
MRLRLAGGLDLAAGALVVSGAGLVVASLVAAVALRNSLAVPSGSPNLTPSASDDLALSEAPADRVAAVLNVDVLAGAGGSARSGDRVDVLGYFSRQITGGDSVTRVLVEDVPVLASDRSGGEVALTLAVPQSAALLLQEAQALGARPFVTLRSPHGTGNDARKSFSDADLAARLAVQP